MGSNGGRSASFRHFHAGNSSRVGSVRDGSCGGIHAYAFVAPLFTGRRHSTHCLTLDLSNKQTNDNGMSNVLYIVLLSSVLITRITGKI